MSTPYIGSKISLISKSEIRYEGVLYTIDPKESTISLAKVRSFGTENRPADKIVAPRDEIYEYIIFRATDIKDLIVEESGTYAPGLSDPAIIQASSVSKGKKTVPNQTFGSGSSSAGPAATSAASATNVYKTSAIQKPATDSSSSFPGFSNAGPATSAVTNPSTVASGPPSTGPVFNTSASGTDFRSGSSTPTPIGHRRSPVSDSGTQHSTGFSNKEEPTNTNRGQQNRQSGNNRQAPNDRRDQQRWQQRRVPGPPPGHQMQQHPPQQQQQQQQQPSQQQHQNQRANNYNNRGSGRTLPGGLHQQDGGGQRRPMWSRPPPQPRVQYRGQINQGNKNEAVRKIDKEYDFEKANQEFQEMESKLANMKVGEDFPQKEAQQSESTSNNTSTNEDNVPEDKKDDEENTFYDKTRSFFDKISCEALERSKGNSTRIDRRQERKMNVETFGVVNNYRRQGGYRGRGGGYYVQRQYRNYNPNYNRGFGGTWTVDRDERRGAVGDRRNNNNSNNNNNKL